FVESGEERDFAIVSVALLKRGAKLIERELASLLRKQMQDLDAAQDLRRDAFAEHDVRRGLDEIDLKESIELERNGERFELARDLAIALFRRSVDATIDVCQRMCRAGQSCARFAGSRDVLEL